MENKLILQCIVYVATLAGVDNSDNKQNGK